MKIVHLRTSEINLLVVTTQNLFVSAQDSYFAISVDTSLSRRRSLVETINEEFGEPSHYWNLGAKSLPCFNFGLENKCWKSGTDFLVKFFERNGFKSVSVSLRHDVIQTEHSVSFAGKAVVEFDN